MFKISQEQKKELLKYLAKRPYIEVAGLVAMIANLEPVKTKENNGKDKVEVITKAKHLLNLAYTNNNNHINKIDNNNKNDKNKEGFNLVTLDKATEIFFESGNVFDDERFHKLTEFDNLMKKTFYNKH